MAALFLASAVIGIVSGNWRYSVFLILQARGPLSPLGCSLLCCH